MTENFMNKTIELIKNITTKKIRYNDYILTHIKNPRHIYWLYTQRELKKKFLLK